MAIQKYRQEPDYLIKKNMVTGQGATYNGIHTQDWYYKSNKVSGQFLTFANGYRFRRATNYYNGSVIMQLSTAQNTLFRESLTGPLILYRSSPGGYGCNGVLNINYNSSLLGSVPVGMYHASAPTGMRNESVTKALLKIADQKVNLGENLATLGQTARLFSESAQTLSKFLKGMYDDKSMRKYLSKSYRDLVREGIPETISNRYLEYVYGWRPLMSDVYALYKLMKDGTQKPLLFQGKGSSNRGGAPTPSANPIGIYNNGAAKITGGTENLTVRCCLWGQIDPNWSGARSINQLGLLNPLSLAWELMPWSFVVDWLLPVGSVLSALSAPAGLIFVDGSIGTRYSATVAYDTWYTYYPSTWIESDVHASGTVVKESYRREVLTSWPLPGLWFDPDPLRGDRIFKAAALLISNIHGVRKSTLG